MVHAVSTPNPEFALIEIARVGRVLTVGLNRPAKRNALNDGIIAEIERCFAGLPDDIGAVVIHGIGEHFSAGLDLSELSERDAGEGVMHSQSWHRVFDRIQFGRVPVIAALKGAVIGGGLEIACAAHVRVAEPSAYFALPEGSRGIFVGGGASVRLPRLIGVTRMMDLMLTGRTYGAEEGQAFGLSHYLVEPGEGLAKGIELAKRIATNSPTTNFAIMHALPRIAEQDRASGYLMESMMAAIAQGNDEAKKRIKDFLEKRAAKVTRK